MRRPSFATALLTASSTDDVLRPVHGSGGGFPTFMSSPRRVTRSGSGASVVEEEGRTPEPLESPRPTPPISRAPSSAAPPRREPIRFLSLFSAAEPEPDLALDHASDGDDDDDDGDVGGHVEAAEAAEALPDGATTELAEPEAGVELGHVPAAANAASLLDILEDDDEQHDTRPVAASTQLLINPAFDASRPRIPPIEDLVSDDDSRDDVIDGHLRRSTDSGGSGIDNELPDAEDDDENEDNTEFV